MRLGEEIAVLDGFDDLGQVYSKDLNRLMAIPSYYETGPQFGVTAGQNLTGGSTWNPLLPLTPSNAGLAGADLPPADADLMGAADALAQRGKGYHRAIPSSYNAGAVFDPTSGQNYKGGSSWDPLMPLTPSVSDLAQVPDVDLAQVYTKNLNRLKGIPNYYAVPNQFDITAGQNLTGGSTWDPLLPLTPSSAGLADAYDGHRLEDIDKHYGSTLDKMPGYYDKGAQFDPSGGQYSGGSSWDPRLPLTPSSSGLAELSIVEPMDGIFDNVFKAKLYRSQLPAFRRAASRGKLLAAKKKAVSALKRGDARSAAKYGSLVKRMRSMRRSILKPAGIKKLKAARAAALRHAAPARGLAPDKVAEIFRSASPVGKKAMFEKAVSRRGPAISRARVPVHSFRF
ncbi:MAG: hypothetical protein ACE5F6_00320 [Anaerolineae bacterium]